MSFHIEADVSLVKKLASASLKSGIDLRRETIDLVRIKTGMSLRDAYFFVRDNWRGEWKGFGKQEK